MQMQNRNKRKHHAPIPRSDIIENDQNNSENQNNNNNINIDNNIVNNGIMINPSAPLAPTPPPIEELQRLRNDNNQNNGNNNVVEHPSIEIIEEYDICTICQDEIHFDQTPVTLLACNHKFHESCWDDFKAAQNNVRNAMCPNCRASVYQNQSISDLESNSD